MIFKFENIDSDLDLLPLAARRALDEARVHLSLEDWRLMPLDARRRLVELGATAEVDATEVRAHLSLAGAAVRDEDQQRRDLEGSVEALRDLLQPSRALDSALWAALSPLEQYALVKSSRRGDPKRVARAYDEIVGARAASSHLSASGEARMVDVGSKSITLRRATASARVKMSLSTLERLEAGHTPKGDVLAAARIAGIMAAKRTSEIIPLCHPVQTTHATVRLELDRALPGVMITATVEAVDRTGVEMEAMFATSAAAMTLYDMLKGLDRAMVIEQLQLESKEGGRSGRWMRSNTSS